ncbi:TetR/AcrR family transcriptional regulator [Arachnia propionica]|uniref:TetR/AcrR family transcriptional regulator n=1 Tax=Arachnia propionica TaxID=1750 RepID=A0A3P1T5N5_9ACTN|nr:TetR/AcrR family transcriptional regulator [Arachnia propionica]RRD04670.1 TetR/AcrR family transcriptional regulator [Arachnia propionica]
MPRASAADAARTATRILQSASRLFATHGHAHVSLDDIAHDAGVTRGAIYHHYQSKKGLFSAVVARLQTEVAGAVLAAAEDANTSPSDQLRAGSHAFLDAITSRDFARILLVDAPSVIGWQEWRRLDDENSVAHLREALRSVRVAENLVEATAAQLSGAMNEAALWIAQHDDPETARTEAHAALDQLLTAYTS